MWKYIGDGAHIPGVPAHDLTEEEMSDLAKEHPGLRKSPLYRQDRKEAPKAAQEVNGDAGND